MKHKKLLLVDDDELVLATFGKGLGDAGYDVRLAGSGDEALGMVAEECPDLAIVDKRMPRMSGFELGRRFAELGVPFIFLSAYSERDYVEEAAEIGTLGYLVKPIDIEKAIPTIEAALRRAKDFAALRQSGNRLELALETGNIVNVVVGIIMERYRLEQHEAFEMLRSRARAQRRKVKDVANESLDAWYKLGALKPLKTGTDKESDVLDRGAYPEGDLAET